MKPDITLVEGDKEKPAAIFIHGMGMDKRIWEAPQEARFLGGSAPVGLLVSRPPDAGIVVSPRKPGGSRLSLGEVPQDLSTLFHDLRDHNYTVISWSQQRPAGEIEGAVAELSGIISLTEAHSKQGIVLIGHSRGGLIGRKYLACGDERVRGLVTLATPHRGSRLATWAGYLAPVMAFVNPLLSEGDRGTLKAALKRITGFLSSRAIRELLPQSAFFRNLDDAPVPGVCYVTIAGKDPTLLSLYRIREGAVPGADMGRQGIKAEKILSIPDVFERLVPDKIIPDEMKMGRGDGLVSIGSSSLPWDHEHHEFPLNHAGVLFDRSVRRMVVDILERVL